MKSLTIGSRGSPLALAQVEIIRGLLAKAIPDLRTDVKIIKTSGDTFTNLSLSAGGGKGLFTKEIEDQLLRGEIDVAVHSLKDLPTILPEGLMIGALPAREDAHDVLMSKKFDSIDKLPPGARVGTSSVRRRAQLLLRRPDLQIEEIRGNIGTRLEKLKKFDAIVLAAAGLKRLGFVADCRPLDFDVMIPAVGQGAIACEVRGDDGETRALLAKINDADTAACTTAERAFLRALGGGCQVPYAAYATAAGETLQMIGAVFSPDVRRTEVTGAKGEPAELGERAAKQVLG